MARQHLQQQSLLWQSELSEMLRMLGFGVNPDRAAPVTVFLRDQLQDLLECRHLELIVVGDVGRTDLRQALARAQALDLREREVLGKPAVHLLPIDELGAAPGRELRQVGNIRCAANLRFMARNEHAVLGHDEIRLDEVGAFFYCKAVGFKGMFRPLAARAAMSNDNYSIHYQYF